MSELIYRPPSPEIILPDGLRAERWIREQRRRERERWKHVRDPYLEWVYERQCAITVTQAPAAVAGSNVTTITVTYSSTAAGALLACTVSHAIGIVTVSSVVDSSTASWTRACQASDGTSACDVWYRENAGAGVTSVTVTFSGNTSSNNGQVAAYEFAGCATSSALGQIKTNTGSQTATTINLTVASFTPDSTTSVILAGGRITATPTNWAAGSADYTLGGATVRGGSEYRIRTTSGNETAPLDAVFGASGTRQWAEAVAEFKPAATGRIFKLAGDGGGLVGPSVGLVG